MKGQPYIYTLPEQFIADKSVPLHWKLYTLINGFWIGGKEVFASNAFFAQKLGCSERYIQDCLAKLEEMQLLRRTGLSQNRRILPWGTNQQFVGGRTDSSKGDEPAVHHISDSSSDRLNSGRGLPLDYSVQEENPRKQRSIKEPLNKKYEEMIGWLRNLTGAPIPLVGKQFKHLAAAHAADISPTDLKHRAEELWEKPFYRENGLDWGKVVSSFNGK